MERKKSHNLGQYQKQVADKYKRYNKIFLTLPFPGLLQSGLALPKFSTYAKKMLKQNKNPNEIVEGFFNTVLTISDPKKIRAIINLFLQFTERQVVLFDALEDSAFPKTHHMTGPGSLQHLYEALAKSRKLNAYTKIMKSYRARLVLTAHPTQFYPSYVIDIIHKLSHALKQDDLNKIQETLLQLGKTSLHNKKSPTPLDEAEFLLLQMRKSFYPAFKRINNPCIELGFWPGGDRDGNPKVNAKTTLEVSKRLKNQILHIYQREIEILKTYLTFPSAWEYLQIIALRLKATRQAIRSQHNLPTKPYKNCQEFREDLLKLKSWIKNHDGGLFLEHLEHTLVLSEQFGFHFASLDLRQDSAIHGAVIEKIMPTRKSYTHFSNEEKMELILNFLKNDKKSHLKKATDKISKDCLATFKNISKIQSDNGPQGQNRYIISHTQSAVQVLEVLLLAKYAELDWKKLPLDIVPLFESVEDLKHSTLIMETLWKNPLYRRHLKHRGNQQTVMVGFSDGTKDGGYFSANWSIYQSKLALSKLAKKYKVDIIFFDGRGGPPSRGGGNTHLFYRALEQVISQQQVQLTIQGQTITTNFGTEDSAQFNTEQLLTSALFPKLLEKTFNPLSKSDTHLLQTISDYSQMAYDQLKNHPLFLPYLSEVCPLNYYGELKIASRPPRRHRSLAFSDLRAIPFVGAWSQMKQNVPGYFGLGSGLERLIQDGQLSELRRVYQSNLYFKTVINNAMMSLEKSNFEITRYLSRDKKFGSFWKILFDEAKLSKKNCLLISNQHSLLENEPMLRKSIEIREKIVFPLLILQQYALSELRTKQNQLSSEEALFLRKLILRSMATNINAARNAV